MKVQIGRLKGIFKEKEFESTIELDKKSITLKIKNTEFIAYKKTYYHRSYWICVKYDNANNHYKSVFYNEPRVIGHSYTYSKDLDELATHFTVKKYDSIYKLAKDLNKIT
jgi:hypothetical protein